MLTGEYGGMAGFRHVMDDLGIEVTDEELTFSLVQLSNAATGRPLTDDELRLTAAYPRRSWPCSTPACSPDSHNFGEVVASAG